MKKLLSIFIFSLTACATAPKVQFQLKGLDTFGSKRITAAEISNQYGKELEIMVHALKEQSENFFPLKKKIESSIKNQYGFALVDLTLITYFAPHNGDYLTVDVVEPEDAAERMSFLPEPEEKFEDPDGLIALWEEYYLKGVELQRAGQYEYHKTCPAWHCIYGFENPKLAPYLEKFNKLIPKNEKKLVRILQKDSRAQFRGNAAFLLAHTKNGSAVIQNMLSVIRDPSEMVRNNAVRVLSEIAWRHPELEIPVQPILQVLNFPAATDRNKAGYTLVFLSRKEKNKKEVIKSAGFILLEMLKLQQPNNHDPAYEVLKNVSGKSFGERDYGAWENWLKGNDQPSATEGHR